jgi:hypothetical protein
MCTVPLPPGVNPIAVKYIISWHFLSKSATDAKPPACGLPAQHHSSYVLLLADTVIKFAEMQAEESGRTRRRWNELDEAKDK